MDCGFSLQISSRNQDSLDPAVILNIAFGLQLSSEEAAVKLERTQKR